MKTGIISILLAAILVLIPCLPALAQESDSETITITMTTKAVIEIEISPTNWDMGTIRPEDKKSTETYFTMTIKGNCNVNTYIKGEDAVCADNPTYKWTLSSDGNNGKGIYVLWVKAEKGDTVRDYFFVTKPAEEPLGEEFWPWSGGSSSSLAPDDTVQFGLKLKAPLADYEKDGVKYFLAGGEMKTTITISGVAA